jgi:hypothetical protein
MKRLLICLLLAGCATQAPVIKTVTVDVPIPVKCAPDVGADPAYPDTDAAILAEDNIIGLAKMYRAGRALRIAREAELKAALKGCTG